MKRFYTASIFLVFIIIVWGFNDKNQNTSKDNLVLSSKQLNANNINTWFRNNGSFNYHPENPNYPGFEWPKGTGKYARFASGLWIGARVGNDTLGVITEYSFEFRPGYTNNNGVPQGENNPLYRVYKLSAYINDDDRLNWPNALLGNSNQGAPVYFDIRTGSWRPLDFGHQTLFYRYTDSYPESHTANGGSTAPLKADVIKLDFSINTPVGLGDISFSQFTIINKSTNTWNDAYFTIWTDDDLGVATDDKVGCDSVLNLGYTYNDSNYDHIYGYAPPAVGFLVLKGALKFTGNNNDTVYICRNKTEVMFTGYKDLKMSVFNWYKCDPFCEDCPYNFRESYMYMTGFNRCRQPRIHPNGYITKYMFSGDPVTNQGWIQPGDGNDQRWLLSTGPVNVAPGDTQVIVIAQLMARGDNNLHSISRLRFLSTIAERYYRTCYTYPDIGLDTADVVPVYPSRFQLYQNYPNPFNPKTTIKFDLPSLSNTELKVLLVVYDLAGREVASLKNGTLLPGTYEVNFDGSNLSGAVYFYRIIVRPAGFSQIYEKTRKMVLIK